jgi:hypothetical protein
MKRIILYFLLLSSSLLAKSQTPTVDQNPRQKTPLFAAHPDKIIIAPVVLDQLFASAANEPVTAIISRSLMIEGVVLEKIAVGLLQESINIRCSNYANALLNVSRIQTGNNKVKYTARIISPAHGDTYVLKEEDGQYSFQKQQQLQTMIQ